MITKENLLEEKTLLEQDLQKTNESIGKLTNDLTQLRANQNAYSGAIQQINKFIAKINDESEAKDKAVKEMVAKG